MDDSQILIYVIAGILMVVILTAWFRLNAFYTLIVISILLAIGVLGPTQTPDVLAHGFGNTLGSIGLIIVFGTGLGVLLEKSGSTIGMANYILRFIRKEKSTRAMAIIGTLTGLPIFCDSGFIVLSGLNRSVSRKSSIPIGKLAAILAISLYTLHCFIPPHPGITAAAGIMVADIGRLILLGTPVALAGIIFGYFWIRFVSSGIQFETGLTESEEYKDPQDIPSPLASFLPVLIPLILISINSISGILGGNPENNLSRILGFTGSPAIALFIGIISAIAFLPGSKMKNLDSYLVESIEKSGPILLITAAGGTFGAVIRETGVGEVFTGLLQTTNLGLLIPFLLAFLLKTAQGSSTVAAITAASIITPMLPGLGIQGELQTLLVLLSLGAGTMAISHANDSFFWVVTKFSGISPRLTLKLFSSATLVVSVFCFILIYGISLLI